MTTQLTPYLNFNAKAGEAMEFYHSVLGGELSMQTFEEAKMARTPGERKLIIHATLKSNGMVIMASDSMPTRQTKFGDNVHLSLSGKDGAELTRVFDQLAAGGRVDMPLAKQFWGDTYGQLTDRFGVHWMVNIESDRPAR